MSEHRLQRGDVTQGAIGRLMGDSRASLVYSDPPRGQGNLQYWRTYNGEAVRPDWTAFREHYIDAVTTYCVGPAFIEMGIRWSDEFSAAFRDRGWSESWRVTVGYGPKKTPKHVLAMVPPGLTGPDVFVVPPGNEWVVNRAMAARYAVPGAVMLDPCLGLGRSAQCFANQGMVIFGNELNPRRLARACRRLAVREEDVCGLEKG